MLSAKELAKPSWQCVHFSQPGVRWQEICDIAQVKDLFLSEIDSSQVSGKEDLFRLISEQLRFPSYFGYNWDAMEECLRDMSWSPAKGYILAIRRAEALCKEHPRLLGSLVQSWLFSAEEWVPRGVPFHLVFLW